MSARPDSVMKFRAALRMSGRFESADILDESRRKDGNLAKVLHLYMPGEIEDGDNMSQRKTRVSKRRAQETIENLDVAAAIDEESPNESDTDLFDSQEAKDDKTSTPSKKNKKMWTDEREQQLLALWSEERHMYDPEHTRYRDNELRNKALKRMAAALGLEGKFVHVDQRASTKNVIENY